MVRLAGIKSLSMILSMMIIFNTGIYTTEATGDLYQVKGYSEDVADFKVSNVVETFDATTIDKAFDAGLIAELPVEIVVENNGGSSFGAYRLERSESGLYGYNPDAQLTVIGEVSTMIPVEGAKKNIFGMYNEDQLEQVTLKIDDLEDHEYQDIEYLPGARIIIDQPGDYYIMFRIKATMGATEAFLRVVDSVEDGQAVENQEEVAEVVEAIPSNVSILVDGTDISFEAYNIGGNNFFKLRDLAFSLNQSNKSFEVGWSEEDRTIEIMEKRPYTTVGGEMGTRVSTDNKGTINKDPVLLNGEEVDLLAYNIGGNNYFKLRDLAEKIDFGVTWDGQSRTIEINTENSYVEEIPQKQIF